MRITNLTAHDAQRPIMKGGVEFRIYSTEKLAATKADDDGKMRIAGIASSTVKDHHGDLMERSALSDMLIAANDNMTIFLNHDYKVPEDVFGSVEKAVIKRVNQATELADYYHTLAMDIVVDENNDRAVKTWKHIENGTKLGLSIGAMIPTDGWSYDEETGLYVIHHVVLLETSVVTIPANPKSWITNAIKAIKSFEGHEVSDDDDESAKVINLSGEDMVEISAKTGDIVVEHEEITVVVEEATEVVTEEVVTEEIIEETADATDEVVEESTEPDTTTDPADEVTQTDSADPTSQEAPEAAPETEDGAEAQSEDVTAGLEDEDPDLSSLAAIVDNLKAIAAQDDDAASLEETVKALEVEKQARLKSEQQLQDLMVITGKLLEGVNQVTALLSKIPAGRKTRFVAEAQSVTDGMNGIYTKEFQSLYQALAAKKE